MKRLSWLLLFSFFLITSAFASSKMYGSFEISNPKIAFFNGADVGVAYFTIVQKAQIPDKLISAKVKSKQKEEKKSFLSGLVSLFSKEDDKEPTIKLHDHIPIPENPDVLTMKEIKNGVDISAATKDENNTIIPGMPVKFETNGKHLMLYNFPDTMRKAPYIEIVLTFKEAGDVAVEFPVNPISSQEEKPCPCSTATS